MKAHDPDDPTTPAATEEEALRSTVASGDHRERTRFLARTRRHAAWETFKAYRPGEKEPNPARDVT